MQYSENQAMLPEKKLIPYNATLENSSYFCWIFSLSFNCLAKLYQFDNVLVLSETSRGPLNIIFFTNFSGATFLIQNRTEEAY